MRRPDLSGIVHFTPVSARIGFGFQGCIWRMTALAAILTDPNVEVYSVRKDGADLGLLELDFRDPDNTEPGVFRAG